MHAGGGPDWSARLGRVADELASRELHVLIISTASNIRYLIGFDGTSGLLVVSRASRRLLVDGRYVGPARQAVEQGRLAQVEVEAVVGPYARALAALLERHRVGRAGFEAGDVTVATLAAWRDAAPGVEWVRTDRLIEGHRLVKDTFELDVFRRAGQLLGQVAQQLPSWVAAGRSEREVARSIEAGLEQAGFSAPAFPTIVASGPHSAHPHARPSARRLQAGDLVVLDFGGVLDGYCVDLTRAACVGPPTPEAQALFEAVRDAHAAAIATVRHGTAASDVDGAARHVLAQRGLGEAFLHAAGHGLGLDVHEAPRIGRDQDGIAEVLESGMVCAIEPGAYVEGFGGVRIEDDVVVTAGGCEVLTAAPRELLVA